MAAVLSVDDITTDHEAYAARRNETFARLVPLRRERRVRLGDLIVLEFESAETLRLQVQEMVFTERLTEPSDVAHEVAAYSRLLPDAHSLVATMLIEVDEPGAVRETLSDLAGVQRAIALRIGDEAVPAVEIPGPDEDPDRPSETVSVHMLRFRLSEGQRDGFRDPSVPAEVVVEHPAYSESAQLSGPTRLALLADLAL
jgi:hypothetical protein